MNPTTTFRLLTADDADIFLALRLRGCREEPAAFLEAPEEVEAQIVEKSKRYFDNGWIAGAFMDNKLIGNAGLYRHKGMKSQHKGTLWGVYVVPEARRNGIAQRCIEMVVHQAKHAGLERVLLDTDVTNAASVALYKNLGFEIVGIEKHIAKLHDRYVDGMLMNKSLLQI